MEAIPMTTMMANIAAQTPQNRDLRRRRRRVASDWARPAGPRPVRVADYGERNSAGVSSARHPLANPVADRVSTPQLVAAGLLSATVVAGLIGLAHWRAGEPAPAPAPAPVVAPQYDAGFAGNAQ
jgi:hypothetical protein